MCNVEINFHKYIKGLKVYLFFALVLFLISIIFNLYLGLFFGKEQNFGIKIFFTFIKIFPTASIFVFFLRAFYYAKQGLKFKDKDTIKYKQVSLLMYKIFFDKKVYKKFEKEYGIHLYSFLTFDRKVPFNSENIFLVLVISLIEFLLGILILGALFLYTIPVFFLFLVKLIIYPFKVLNNKFKN